MGRSAAALLMIAWPAIAMAQSAATTPAASGVLPPIGLPLPAIGLPLPSIGLPLAPVGLPSGPTDTKSPGTGKPSTDNRPTGGGRGGAAAPAIFFLPMYGWGYDRPGYIAPDTSAEEESAADRKPVPQTGRLRLDLKPEGLLQLYVDGYYVGTPEDVSGELELEAGLHRIEIRAPRYESSAFDVKIERGRSITYRGELKRTAASSAPHPAEPSTAPAVPSPPVQPPHSTLYFIPGCYLGNVPPEDVALPSTCDLSRLVVRRP